MKLIILIGLATAGALATGCANVERSRDIGNPKIAATTLAQQVCSNCHGLRGISTSPNFPNLAGQTETYLVAQLAAFKSHERRDPAGFEYMWGLSRSLTTQQIDGLAAYFAAQPPPRGAGTGDPARLAAGKAIFDDGIAAGSVPACSGCHGADGQGNGGFARIAAQHRDYIIKQLAVFQNTEERPAGVLMKGVTHRMSRKDMDDVASYLEAMPGP